MHREHRRNDSAFTVANEADSFRVEFLAGFQIGERGFGIAGKILGGRVGVLAGGLADPPLIETKNGNAFVRQMVRQNEKWAMSDDTLIAVVRPRAGKEDGNGKGTLARRNRERSRKRDFRFVIGKGNFLFLIRIRLYRVLGADQLKELIG